jgi:hypothetical protein
VARVAGWQHAVEKVNPEPHRLKYVCRRSHPHEIPRLVLRHMWLDNIDYPVHFPKPLAHRKPTYGVARQVKLCNPLHVSNPQILICAALIDSEEQLVFVYSPGQRIKALELVAAAHKPSGGSLAGLLHIVIRRGVSDTLVKGHCNGGGKV